MFVKPGGKAYGIWKLEVEDPRSQSRAVIASVVESQSGETKLEALDGQPMSGLRVEEFDGRVEGFVESAHERGFQIGAFSYGTRIYESSPGALINMSVSGLLISAFWVFLSSLRRDALKSAP